ncbi:MAG TPA: amino acid permease [Blastocatellia bacterium]|nr:amino acid permease [Blastocatellia bacterium]
MEQTTQEGLVRGIRRWDLVALTVNIIVGAGIFGLPARVYGLTGAWSVLAYIVCAALATLIILCFAEVGSRFAETGGPYLYTRVAFGPIIGFEVGWLLWLARLTGFAALCNLLLGYLSFFWPDAAFGWTRAVVVTVVVITLTAINVIGVREAALVSNVFTIGKIAPLLLFVIAGLFFLSPQPFTAHPVPGIGDFSRAVLLLVFAFSGFEMAVIPTGEVRNPQKNIAFALLTATGIVALIYLMIQIVCIGTLPELANSERPLVDASRRFLGQPGAVILSVGALLSVTGTLNSIMLAGPRILFAMAEHGQLPQSLATTHRRFHTPHIAILISAAVMLAFTLQGTFMSALTISTVIRLLAYIATCISLPVLRFRKNAPLPRFNAPAGVSVAVAATALSVWLLSNSTMSEAIEAGLAAALGLVVFFVLGKFRASCS